MKFLFKIMNFTIISIRNKNDFHIFTFNFVRGTKHLKSQFAFLRSNGRFRIDNPELCNGLYMPLTNESGIKSSITPVLGGDIKKDQNSFLMPPVSVYDLHNNRSSRNFWLFLKVKNKAWSATGVSADALNGLSALKKEKTFIEAGLLWQRVTRENTAEGITAEITSFVPANDDSIELTEFKITNSGSEELDFKPYTAIPFFGRSADNLRDHRHVTSLLNRCRVYEEGIVLKPTLSFNEYGHSINQTAYGAFCVSDSGELPLDACPSVDEFIGNGGTFEAPAALGGELPCREGDTVDGTEVIAALRLPDRKLKPGESASYIVGLAVLDNEDELSGLCSKYGTQKCFYETLENTEWYWNGLLKIKFNTGEEYRDGWLKWVSVQPVLRRMYGNSFLPHYDYGRGGRGWRDLWQDYLTLLLMSPEKVRGDMVNFLAGVRTDGSNATVIGEKPGDFVVDRNGVRRVWMDHGVWPFFTVMLYIMQTNDFSILTEKQVYFRDERVRRSKATNREWTAENGKWLRKRNGELYYGTVLEHLLTENLTAVYSVGEHNMLKLEDGDWNDGLDMASNRGESVAFTSFYYSNLLGLAELCEKLEEKGINEVTVSEILKILIDSDAETADEKSAVFNHYLDICDSRFAENTVNMPASYIAKQLRKKAERIKIAVNSGEWINGEGCGWYNSYYDDEGKPTDGIRNGRVNMMLTGQVYAVMSGLADEKRVNLIIRAADKYLYCENGGYRLNTEFEKPNYKMGRMFGFAYGTKENGAVFSHMAVMYAYALYSRNRVREGYRVINALYRGSSNFDVSGMYPGIPEYFEPNGHASYPYLTGSASWMLFVLLTMAYGARGIYGDLLIEPKLLSEQFGEDKKTSVHFIFGGKRLCVCYKNKYGKDYGEYRIGNVNCGGISYKLQNGSIVIPASEIKGIDTDREQLIEIELE